MTDNPQDIKDKAGQKTSLDSNHLLQKALDDSLLAWWFFDLQTGVSEFSPVLSKLLGYSSISFPEAVAEKIILPEDYEIIQEKIGLLIAGKIPVYEAEFRIKDKYGKTRWLFNRGNIVERLPDGTPLKMGGITMDITQQKVYEEKFEQVKTKYHHLFNNSAAALFICSFKNEKTGRFLEVNNKFIAQFNCSRKNILNKDFCDIIIPENHEDFAAAIEKIKSHDCCVFRAHANDSRANEIFEISLKSFKIDSEKVIMGYSVPLAEKIKIEQELADSNKKYNDLNKNLPVMLFRYQVRPEAKFEYVNPAAEKITGYPAKDFLENPLLWQKLIPQKEQLALKQALRKRTQHITFKVSCWHKNGNKIWLELHNTLTFDSNGKLNLLEGIGIDTSHQVNLAHQLKKGYACEHAISIISSRFVKNGNFIDNLTETLKELVALCECQRGTIFKLQNDLLQPRTSWSSKDNNEFLNNQLSIPYCESLADLEGKIKHEAALIYNRDTDSTNDKLSTFVQKYNINSMLICPIWYKFQLLGFMLLDNDSPHNWDSQAINACQIVTEIISNAFIRNEDEQVIRLREAEFSGIVNALPDIVLKINDQGVFTQCHTPDNTDLYLKPDGFLNKKVHDVLSPDIADKTLQALKETLNTGKTQYYEYTLPIKGQNKYFEARMVYISKDEILLLIRNITSRKTAKMELERYKNYLETVFSNIPAVLFIKTLPDFKYSLVNKRFSSLVKIPAAELLGKNDFELFRNADAEVFRKEDTTVAQSSVPMEFDNQVIDANGNWRYFKTIKLTFRQNDQTMLLGMADDITDRVKFEQELAESEERYRTLIEAAEDRIALTDMQGKIILANDAFYSNIGFSPGEFDLNERLTKAFPEEREPFEYLVNFLLDHGACQIEYSTHHKKGYPMQMLAKAVLIRDNNDTPESILTIIRDISEIKKIQNKLLKAKEDAEKSDKLKSAFLANMSHEIRTPMNAIVGFANLLTAQDLTRQERKNYISIINKSSNQLLNLVSDIIDISKIESGQLDINMKNVSAVKVFHNLQEIFSKQLPREIELRQKIPPKCEDVIICADDTRFTQIFNNLLNNALKFTEAGFIEYGFHLPHDNMVTFYVKDSGIGVAPENQTIIFERFRQADDSYTRKFGGTGLGLAICKNLVELMGGKIWIESELNKGATFCFTLPLISIESKASAVQTHYATPAFTKYKWPGKKILLVDDTKICLKYLQAILKDSEMELFFADSAREAIDIFKKHQDIDVVLMDIQMPGMNGLEATAAIKKIRKNICVIAQTAYAFESDKERFLQEGCDDYIAKPINSGELLDKLANVFNPIEES
jgi:PAS domain S-box-containing protein